MDVSIHYNLVEWSQSKLDKRESQDMLSWESLNLLDTGSCDSCLVPLTTWLHLELTNTCKGFFLLVKFLKVWRPSFIVDLLRWEDPSLIWAAYIKTQKKEAFSLLACLVPLWPASLFHHRHQSLPLQDSELQLRHLVLRTEQLLDS